MDVQDLPEDAIETAKEFSQEEAATKAEQMRAAGNRTMATAFAARSLGKL